jgi:hypothetical protein
MYKVMQKIDSKVIEPSYYNQHLVIEPGTQQDYKKLGLGNNMAIKDIFSIIYNPKQYSEKMENIHKLTRDIPPQEGERNIISTMEFSPLWFNYWFVLFSELILFASMLIYFYMSYNRKEDEKQKWSLYLFLPIVFNIILLPFLLTFYFNTRWGLVRSSGLNNFSRTENLKENKYTPFTQDQKDAFKRDPLKYVNEFM